MAEAKILVVDDEKNILLTVRHALEPQGYEVTTASHRRGSAAPTGRAGHST